MPDRKGITIPNWVPWLIIVLLIVTPLGAMAKNAVNIDLSSLFGGNGGGDFDFSQTEFYVGTVTIGINEVNVEDDAAESLTSSSFTAYHGVDGAGVGGKAISASGTDFKLNEADQGIVYMKVYAGTAHYIVEDELVNYNNEIESVEWKDLDGDNLDDCILRINLADLRESTLGVKPTWDLVLPVIDEDVTGITDNNPGDATNKATNTTMFLTWHISGISPKAGFVISRLWFSTNETREGTDIKLTTISVSGMGLDWARSAPAFTQGGPNAGDYEAWYWRSDDYNDYHRGLMAIRGANKADDLTITLGITLTLDASDVLYVQLEMEYVEAEGTLATHQDQVVISY